MVKIFGVGVYSSQFTTTNGTNPSVGGINVRSHDFSFNYENDYMFGSSTADNGDRYRTTAARVSIGEYHFGINLYTEDPNDPMVDKDGSRITRPFTRINGHDTYNGIHANDFRAGVFSVGYENYNIGINSERVRHIFQNRLAHDIILGGKAKWFEILNIKPKAYVSYSISNAYTLW